MTEQIQQTTVTLDRAPTLDITEDVYYKRLQKELAEKKEASPTKQTEKPTDVQKILPPILSKETSMQPSLRWTMDTDGNSTLDTSDTATSASTTLTKQTPVSFLAHAIKISDKQMALLEQYKKYYIHARSHNMLFAKFAQLKSGFLLGILSVLGVPFDEIKKLQKEALKEAIENNITNFNENEFNHEMIQTTSTKKSMQESMLIIEEIRGQLIKQMKNLDKGNYYTDIKIKEIQKEQLQAIISKFMEEKANLLYQIEFI